MSENRNEQRAVPSAPSATVLVAETLRSSAQAGTPDSPAKGEERLPLFWRICGGTLLSIVALVAVTAYQQFTNSLNELRSELSHLNNDLRKDLGRLNETHGELVKKDEFNTRMKSVWENLKELRTDNATVAVLKERSALQEQQWKIGEEERKEQGRELLRLREAKAGEDERKELLRELQRLRERLATVEGRQVTPPVKSVSQGDN